MYYDPNAELAVHDLQRRLQVLGYQLGDEAEQGLFGDKTATAVASFKQSTGLGFDDVIDQTTWIALKDASMQMGDRTLYLHMPHFRGRDVGDLQSALCSMGFTCALDNGFGPETEQALRDFQDNMGLVANGILDGETLATIVRFKHIWEGKRGMYLEGRTAVSSRKISVLEANSLCVFGQSELTRSLANRIVNLARATTIDSKIVSVSSLDGVPGHHMLLVGLRERHPSRIASSTRSSTAQRDTLYSTSSAEEAGEAHPPVSEQIPCVAISPTEVGVEALVVALRAASTGSKRLFLEIDAPLGEAEASFSELQELAVYILDKLCLALEQMEEQVPAS